MTDLPGNVPSTMTDLSGHVAGRVTDGSACFFDLSATVYQRTRKNKDTNTLHPASEFPLAFNAIKLYHIAAFTVDDPDASVMDEELAQQMQKENAV